MERRTRIYLYLTIRKAKPLKEGKEVYCENSKCGVSDIIIFGLSTYTVEAIGAASGVGYDFGQSLALYPTSGGSDDYAYSRHFVDGTKGKILSFTVECGQSFQPPWQEAEGVIREIWAGLVVFCLAAQKRTTRATGPSV